VGLHVVALRRLTTAVLVVVLLGGCVTTTRKTMYTAGPRAAAFIAVDRDTVDRCMRQRGYTPALLAE
jgi:hypothetical protein